MASRDPTVRAQSSSDVGRRATVFPVGRRRAILLAVVATSTMLAATGYADPAPRLLWNASASVPIGFYRVGPGRRPRRGDLAVAWAPAAARELAARRGYLPRAVPLLKPVAAIAGDRICAKGVTVTVSGGLAADRLRADASGRALPAWDGCRTLRSGQAFLLARSVRGSFDGRYFGVTEARDIVGTAWRQ